MQLIAVGLNHKTAPVEIRERFSIPKERVRGGLITLSGYETVNEAVVLSTCNRSEIYAVAENAEGGVDALKDFWAELTGIDETGYTLYGGAKDLYFGTRSLCLNDLTDAEIISSEAYELIVTAMAIKRYGTNVLSQ